MPKYDIGWQMELALIVMAGFHILHASTFQITLKSKFR